ncbi:CoA-binding protein [Pelotomaculum terephthalicicum JT]|uniref:acetate--CoA ligase family protein n=1 Tax=Pelotomaculum TaxID=191373 RepID=UPI0009D4A651|nr:MULTISPECIES: CoA-binding protein [Pelotomaculum]MCG9968882.1 CoA-binding protein [Pelotomaculum terephthalicicum JT]OPX87448.1 MAG: succinyl-CoA synthetase subunit alpha [Pelotomaculum sp. PtaB.Bin117]OPY61587.1 MAG: succinyl-CoA synthetase subunit alpha [Pelotomaculum sp. PtaU1.Bin065]
MSGTRPVDLRPVFYPRRVAVFGVTDTPDRVGYNVLESILHGGFTGKVYPIHPRHEQVLGCKVYKSLEDLPEPVDLAVICLNQDATVEAVEKCGRAGVRGVICNAGGYRETGEVGRDLEKRLIAAAEKYRLPMIGPNTLGMINNDGNFYSTFYPLKIPAGKVSIISQSGGIGLTTIHLAVDEGIGINKFIGVGNCSNLGFTDCLDYLENDDSTAVIGVFIEGSADAGRFVRAAGRVARKKPVVVYKAGRLAEADRYTQTHTGSSAGSFQLYQDILHQYGVFTVNNVSELVAACKALALQPLPEGNRVGILTHTAGPSVVMIDHLAPAGCVIPPLHEKTISRVKQIIGSDNPPVVLKNPLDAAGLGFSRPTYGGLAEAMLADDNVDLLLAVYCLHKTWELPAIELINAHKKYEKPLIVNFVGNWQGCRADQDFMQNAGVPLYTAPEKTAVAAAALVHYGMLRKGGADRDS